MKKCALFIRIEFLTQKPRKKHGKKPVKKPHKVKKRKEKNKAFLPLSELLKNNVSGTGWNGSGNGQSACFDRWMSNRAGRNTSLIAGGKAEGVQWYVAR